MIKRRSEETPDTLQGSGLSPLLQRIYVNRGIKTSSELDLGLKQLLKPELLKGISPAVDLLVHALQTQQSVLIVGDFDADGATSTAVALKALSSMGLNNIDFLVPNRFEFGYGLTPEIVAVAAAMPEPPQLLLTVDNGISSVEGVAAANNSGMQVLVTDHHLPGAVAPDAAAIVNPNQHGCEFPSKNLAGVGVVFYLMLALRARLRELNWFETKQIPEPNLAELLDLVALGTVADVVPLDHNNRILVQQGLGRIRSGRCRPGIQAILDIAGREAAKLSSVDLGFVLGPRLNAAGRLDDMSLGINCLCTTDPGRARALATELDDLNRDRKSIEQSMQQEAMKTLATMDLLDNAESEAGDSSSQMPWGLCLYQADWHQGVIGILASRIKDKFHRPVIAFANASDDGSEIKGSARSIPGLHIRDALDSVAAREPSLLKKFGGHAMAAGMSLAAKDFDRFQQVFDEVVRSSMDEAALTASLASDGELPAQDLVLPTAQALMNAGPWGQNFPEPRFDGEFYLVNQRIVGERHLKLVLSTDAAGQQIFDAIAFNVDVQLWPNYQTKKVRLVYKLDINEFRGRTSLQLMVDFIEAIDES